jgi:hemerythrin-like domain-containing protein
MNSTDVLKQEHHLILSVLRGAKKEVQQIASTGKVDIEVVENIIDFLKNFTDRSHHAKEEKLLFPKMIERGAWKDGPIAAMIREHSEGRKLISTMSEDLDRFKKNDLSAAKELRENLSRYIDLMWWHIQKEDTIVFDIADRMLTFQDQNELQQQFHEVEKQELGEGAYERYRHLAEQISHNVGTNNSLLNNTSQNRIEGKYI